MAVVDSYRRGPLSSLAAAIGGKILSPSIKKSSRRKEENGGCMKEKGEHQEEASLHITNPTAGTWLHSKR
jgi:hypothetical protein